MVLFFFVNSGSGGKKAHLLLGLQAEEIKFVNFVGQEGSLENVDSIVARICSLTDQTARCKALKELKAETEKQSSPSNLSFYKVCQESMP